jgi:hypothetical protein
VRNTCFGDNDEVTRDSTRVSAVRSQRLATYDNLDYIESYDSMISEL